MVQIRLQYRKSITIDLIRLYKVSYLTSFLIKQNPMKLYREMENNKVIGIIFLHNFQ